MYFPASKPRKTLWSSRNISWPEMTAHLHETVPIHSPDSTLFSSNQRSGEASLKYVQCHSGRHLAAGSDHVQDTFVAPNSAGMANTSRIQRNTVSAGEVSFSSLLQHLSQISNSCSTEIATSFAKHHHEDFFAFNLFRKT